MASKHVSTHVSRRVRLPEFMWLALEQLTAYTNEKAIANPDDYVSVSGLIESIILASVKVPVLELMAASSPEFRKAIEAWVAWQIENDPATAAVFSTGVWSFTTQREN